MRRSLLTAKSAGHIPYDVAVGADAPRIWWRLGEASGTSAADASGHGFVGTYSGSPTLGVTGLLTGESNTAVQFDGVDDKITVADTTDLTSFAVEAWIKTAPGAQAQTIAGRGDGSNSTIFRLDVNSNATGTARLIVGTAGSLLALSGTTRVDNSATHHIVGVFDNAADQIRLYVDGVLDNSATKTGDPAANDFDFLVGRSGGANAFWFNGVMDEVAYYDYALSAARILAHYQSGIGL